MLVPISARAVDTARGNIQEFLSEGPQLHPLSFSLVELCAVTAIEARLALEVDNRGVLRDDLFHIEEALPGSPRPRIQRQEDHDPNFSVTGLLSPAGVLRISGQTVVGPRGAARLRSRQILAQREIRRILALFGNRVRVIDGNWLDSDSMGDVFHQYIDGLTDQGVTEPYEASREQHLRALAKTFPGQLLGRLGFTEVEVTLSGDSDDDDSPVTQIHARFSRPADASIVPPGYPPTRIKIDADGWEVSIGDSMGFLIHFSGPQTADAYIDAWDDQTESEAFLKAARSWILATRPGAVIRVRFNALRVSAAQRTRIDSILNPTTP